MPTKPVTIEVIVRDNAEGTLGGVPFAPLYIESAQGSTEDEGATCIIGNGYVPSISNAAPADIQVTVHQPSELKTPVSLVTRVDDAVENTSTLTFNLTP